MKAGGNKNLKDFLNFCGIDRDLVSKKQFFSSKIMNYYRKKVLNLKKYFF